MSTRFTFRYAGTVGRWMTPGVNTTGSPDAASARAKVRSPPMPPPSLSRARYASRMSVSVRSRALRSGSPYPEGPAMRSSGMRDSSRTTKRLGSASASRVGKDSSRNTRPSSSPHTSMLTVPGSIPMTRGIRSPGRRNGRRRRGRLHQLARDLPDRLGVEHEIISLEQLRDAALVHLHLEVADAERAECLHAVAVDTGVRDVDPVDA